MIICEDFIDRYGFSTSSFKTYKSELEKSGEKF